MTLAKLYPLITPWMAARTARRAPLRRRSGFALRRLATGEVHARQGPPAPVAIVRPWSWHASRPRRTLPKPATRGKS